MPLLDRFRTPPHGLTAGKRVYAVGDIHGRADLLDRLLLMIKTDAEGYAGEQHLVTLGDYHNRGLDGAAVFDRLVHLLDAWPEWHITNLRGNHELAMQEFLASPLTHGAWLSWGGLQTLESYGIRVQSSAGEKRSSEALAAELTHVMEERGHLSFLHNLHNHDLIDGLLMVHAGIRPEVPLDRQDPRDLVFIRDDFLNRPHRLPYRVVFGHTPMPEPLVSHDRVGLDTGAYRTGKLTAGVFEGRDLRLLQTD